MFVLLEIGGQGPSMNDVSEYFEHQRTSAGADGERLPRRAEAVKLAI